MSFKKISNWPVFVWLLAAYPILFLYAGNVTLLFGSEVLVALLITLAATTLIFVLLRLVMADSHTAAAVTAAITAVFFSYGHLANILKSIDDRFPVFPLKLAGQVLAAGLILLVIYLAFRVYRLGASEKLRSAASYVNLVALVLVLFTTGQIALSVINIARARAPQIEPQPRNTEIVLNSVERPDVYYIILDAYSSNSHLLREYGFDNSAFTNALEERGFYVAYDSKSNYPITLMSLSSSLNMRYIDIGQEDVSFEPNTYLRTLVADSRVAQEFQNLGYEYVFMLSGFAVPSATADVNIEFFWDGPRVLDDETFDLMQDGALSYKQPFWPLLLETTLLRSMVSPTYAVVEDRPIYFQLPQRALATFNEAETIPDMESATFTFVHIMKPHTPVEFDREGNILDEFVVEGPELYDAYFEQLEWVNARTLQMIDHIIASSDQPPIIILQADHGSNLGEPKSPDGHYAYFEILNAYYFPDGGDAMLTQDITPINSFRVLFNTYFGSDYELLEDRHFNLPEGYDNVFDIEEVDIDTWEAFQGN